jgi:hypothetical protein
MAFSPSVAAHSILQYGVRYMQQDLLFEYTFASLLL